MQPVRYLGNNTFIFLQAATGGGALLVGLCNRNLEYQRSRELVETTTLEGYEVGHVLGIKRGQVQANNLSFSIPDSEGAFYDELCRQWFEAGTLLACRIHDDPDGPNERVLDFHVYMDSWRIVRNNNEVANFDINLIQTQPPTAQPGEPPTCPIISVSKTDTTITLTFTGVVGIQYTFNLSGDIQTIVAAPWSVTYSGLTPSTVYNITWSAYDYDQDLETTCTDIEVTTEAEPPPPPPPGANLWSFTEEPGAAGILQVVGNVSGVILTKTATDSGEFDYTAGEELTVTASASGGGLATLTIEEEGAGVFSDTDASVSYTFTPTGQVVIIATIEP